MAVSGRKISDYEETVSRSSTEDIDGSCGPCSAFDKRSEPHGYCVDCHEYLCKDCYIYHQKVKVSKHHQLLDKNHIHKEGIPSNASDVCTERCSIHKNEVIKFYCPIHDVLGCTDCMTLNHRTCDLHYIPDKCKDIGDSDEYSDAIRTLEEKSNKVKTMTLKAAVKDKEIDEMHDTATKEMEKYRQEINVRLDAIQMKSQTDVDNRMSSDKQNIQSVIASCIAYSSEINKLQSCLHYGKTRKENAQLFIGLKGAKAALTTSMQEAEETLDRMKTTYNVTLDEDFQSILFKQPGLVNICEIPTQLTTQPPKTEIRSLNHKDDIKVKTNTGNETCNITGCEILAADKLILADWKNKAVKIVDIQRKVVADEKILDSSPFDIAVLPGDQVAVTVPDKGKILTLTTVSKLAIRNTVSVKGYCFGIIYHEDKLYVVCQTPRRVLRLDLQGNVEITMPLKDDYMFFSYAMYINMSHDHKSVCVSTGGKNPAIRLSLQGEITAIGSDFSKDVQNPRGMTMLSDGSILVCCSGSNEIYRLSEDLKNIWACKDGLDKPYSICYSSDRNEVYVGSFPSDYLQVFTVNYQ